MQLKLALKQQPQILQMLYALLIDKDALQMELDASNLPPYAQLIKELKRHAKHLLEEPMVFVIILQVLLLLQLVLQELVLLIPLQLLMLLALHGKVPAFGLELLDVKTPLLVQDSMEQSIHAQHLQEAMDHAQEQDQHQ